MANLLNILITDDLEDILTEFDQIQVFRADLATDPFVEVSGVGTRPVLNTQDTLYSYTDPTGVPGQFYQTRYYNSITFATGPFSVIFQPANIVPTPIADSNGLTIFNTLQLENNMKVFVTLSEDIEDTSGNTLGTEFVSCFMTPLTPFYCSFEELDSEIGIHIADLDIQTIYLQIFRASLEADALTFTPAGQATNTDYFKHIRKSWTCCRASETLLMNVMGSSNRLKSKSLDNFKVDYNTESVTDALQRALACKADLHSLLNSAGRKQRMAVYNKGSLNPDTPVFGRGWVPTLQKHSHPAANAKTVLYASNPWSSGASRRSSKTFSRRNFKW